ncbi:unnamed protein product [Pleuronectes platessa]|uniref:Uncharacterized protein n=1 Tax=Pleuronectes platessa TaxID=8262 RepID=A0A9N7ZDH5_PLEPL|nr:unnamed protein product [Pleuronectes platessa]
MLMEVSYSNGLEPDLSQQYPPALLPKPGKDNARLQKLKKKRTKKKGSLSQTPVPFRSCLSPVNEASTDLEHSDQSSPSRTPESVIADSSLFGFPSGSLFDQSAFPHPQISPYGQTGSFPPQPYTTPIRASEELVAPLYECSSLLFDDETPFMMPPSASPAPSPPEQLPALPLHSALNLNMTPSPHRSVTTVSSATVLQSSPKISTHSLTLSPAAPNCGPGPAPSQVADLPPVPVLLSLSNNQTPFVPSQRETNATLKDSPQTQMSSWIARSTSNGNLAPNQMPAKITASKISLVEAKTMQQSTSDVSTPQASYSEAPIPTADPAEGSKPTFNTGRVSKPGVPSSPTKRRVAARSPQLRSERPGSQSATKASVSVKAPSPNRGTSPSSQQKAGLKDKDVPMTKRTPAPTKAPAAEPSTKSTTSTASSIADKKVVTAETPPPSAQPKAVQKPKGLKGRLSGWTRLKKHMVVEPDEPVFPQIEAKSQVVDSGSNEAPDVGGSDKSEPDKCVIQDVVKNTEAPIALKMWDALLFHMFSTKERIMQQVNNTKKDSEEKKASKDNQAEVPSFVSRLPILLYSPRFDARKLKEAAEKPLTKISAVFERGLIKRKSQEDEHKDFNRKARGFGSSKNVEM